MAGQLAEVASGVGGRLRELQGVGYQVTVVEFWLAALRVAWVFLQQREVEFARYQAGQRGLRFLLADLDPQAG